MFFKKVSKQHQTKYSAHSGYEKSFQLQDVSTYVSVLQPSLISCKMYVRSVVASCHDVLNFVALYIMFPLFTVIVKDQGLLLFIVEMKCLEVLCFSFYTH